ncbi:MAG: prepilin peptidase [Phycisphaerae bacterium]|nr:prepilin peptidase [Phycisphaerae bacterium]
MESLPDWVLVHGLAALGAAFAFCMGACAGSFINVVVMRWPLGMSIVAPPSRCPVCGLRLAWWQNLPVVGWFIVRGRCAGCGVRISPQYLLLELIVGALFALLWWQSFGGTAAERAREAGLGWFAQQGFWRSLPMLVSWAWCIGSLVAISMIDARTFTIPLAIPVISTVVAFAAAAVQGWMPHPGTMVSPLPAASMWMAGAAIGGLVGTIKLAVLLRTGVLRPGFHDYDQFVPEGELFANYPHARREAVRELGHACIVLVPAVVGGFIGAFLGDSIGNTPPWFEPVAASMLGYLVGGGIIWAIRIAGTLAFGREAMGFGDVHILGCAGACFGWIVPLAGFFLAPFVALVAMAMFAIASRKGRRRELPYGPYLAAAVLLLVYFRPWFVDLGRLAFPGIVEGP